MPRFDQYLFADYVGSGGHDKSARGLRLVGATATGQLRELRSANGRHWSRASLYEFVCQKLDLASKQGKRVVFGFDHQYSWPLEMLRLASLDIATEWRELIASLVNGDSNIGRPAFDSPRQYAKAFNAWCRRPVFYSKIRQNSNLYEIPNTGTAMYRATEEYAKRSGGRPAPANGVGGNGDGAVGGQTLCGLQFLSKFIARNDVRAWPFDGLDLSSYKDGHLLVELYPTGLRPRSIRQSDLADAACACETLRFADRAGRLDDFLRVPRAVVETAADRVAKEGWIAGVGDEIPDFTPGIFEEVQALLNIAELPANIRVPVRDLSGGATAGAAKPVNVRREEAIDRLVTNGNADAAEYLKKWRNAAGRTGGWDGHMKSRYPDLASVIWR